MGERFPGDSAAVNGFGRRLLHEWEARLLQQANYPCPPDMQVPGSWKLSAGGVPVPPPPAGEEFVAEVEAIRNAMPPLARDEPKFAANNHQLWTAYFDRRHADALASINGGPAPSGRQNSNGRHLFWGVPGRTLLDVLAHIEGGNEPPLEYLAPTLSSHSRRREQPLQPSHAGGSTPSWVPRRMKMATSSSSGSGSGSRSSGAARSPLLVPVKPEPQTPLGRRTRADGLVINEGRSAPVSSPPRRSFLRRLVNPKKELSAAVKEEHETGLAKAKEDYVDCICKCLTCQ